MSKIVGFNLNESTKIDYLLDEKDILHIGDFIIIGNDQEKLFAKTVSVLSKDRLSKQKYNLIRKASKSDIEKNKKNIDIEKKALKKCKELVKKYNLNMYIIDSNYSFDHSQLTFRFLSNNRVDFRKLAKDLANIYKTRIELRQIGVRDKAKNVGGCGQCGMTLCCSKFLNDFDSVSINMAKNQNIALNPSKINGVCGRLLCCLNYEDDCYKKCRKHLPSIGKKIKTKYGDGKVISVDILKESYKVMLSNNDIIEIKRIDDESN